MNRREKKTFRKRKKKQAALTMEHGTCYVAGEVEVDGVLTRDVPRRILTFRGDTAAVVEEFRVEHGADPGDLPPVCPRPVRGSNDKSTWRPRAATPAS